MSRTRCVLVVAAIVALLAAGSQAAFSQELLTKKAIPGAMAAALAEGAVEKCRADGYHVSATVLDDGGRLLAFARDDDASLNTIEFSHLKANTAFIYRRPSAETAKAWATTPPTFKPDGTVGAAGAVPIKAGNETIGAIGVSGAPGGDKDEACAVFALSKYADKLK